MRDLERARRAVQAAEARKLKAEALALATAGWLGVPNDHVTTLGETVVVRGEAIDKLAEMAGVGEGPKAERVERLEFDQW